MRQFHIPSLKFHKNGNIDGKLLFFTKRITNANAHMCTRCTYAFVLPSSEDNLEEMKHELGPIKYDKACLTLLAVPSKNSHVISHCIDYICVLCATILEKGARSAKSLKMTLEVRRAPAASFSQQVHPRVKKTRLEENTTPPPFFTKRNRRRLP